MSAFSKFAEPARRNDQRRSEILQGLTRVSPTDARDDLQRKQGILGTMGARSRLDLEPSLQAVEPERASALRQNALAQDLIARQAQLGSQQLGRSAIDAVARGADVGSVGRQVGASMGESAQDLIGRSVGARGALLSDLLQNRGDALARSQAQRESQMGAIKQDLDIMNILENVGAGSRVADAQAMLTELGIMDAKDKARRERNLARRAKEHADKWANINNIMNYTGFGIDTLATLGAAIGGGPAGAAAATMAGANAPADGAAAGGTPGVFSL